MVCKGCQESKGDSKPYCTVLQYTELIGVLSEVCCPTRCRSLQHCEFGDLGSVGSGSLSDLFVPCGVWSSSRIFFFGHFCLQSCLLHGAHRSYKQLLKANVGHILVNHVG